jgi:two-component system phosphate regulon sensor histidine kinase PhoR
MSWFLFSLAACALTVLYVRHSRLLQNTSRLEKTLGEMSEGKRPATFVFHNGPLFVRAALHLEKISDRQEKLARQIDEEAFNLRAILASMAEGVAVLDSDRKIRLANDSLRKLFAIDFDPAGKTVLAALRVEDVAGATLQSGLPQTREISITRTGRAEPLHLVASAAPMAGANGESRGAVLVFHDISRLRQLEEIRRQFVSNVSHELRTPLSIFQGYLENLVDNPAQPKRQLLENLQVMQRHSLRLNAILEDLLTLARLESRQDQLELEALDLRAFFTRIAKDWSLKFAQKKIDISLDIAAKTVNADASRLEQVFTNLIDNAVRYAPADTGRIVISTKDRDGLVEIRVEDNGPGIPPSDLPHIFERFYRVEKARTRDRGGTGLGLSIVKHIVALHGGSVRAESRFGEGTAIVIELPQQPSIL